MLSNSAAQIQETKPVRCTGFESGADEQIRTADLLITNQLLYQLSYVGTGEPNLDSSAAPYVHASEAEPSPEMRRRIGSSKIP